MGRETRFFAGAWMTDFQILETLALEQGVARHLDRHLARMAASSAHFGYPWDEARVRACLADLAAGHASGLWRVRLLLDGAGNPQAQAFALQPTAQPVRLQLADRPLQEAHDEWVRHKTQKGSYRLVLWFIVLLHLTLWALWVGRPLWQQ